jgi:hypothetical protein
MDSTDLLPRPGAAAAMNDNQYSAAETKQRMEGCPTPRLNYSAQAESGFCRQETKPNSAKAWKRMKKS